MSVVSLTFTSSNEEITYGIPKTVSITSNVPATIYYTLDGTTPDIDSTIYISAISMPDGEDSIILSAFGVDADGYSGSILSKTYAANWTAIEKLPHHYYTGVVVDRYSDNTNIVVGYDADGDPNAYTDISNIYMDELHSAKGMFGIADGTLIEIGTPVYSDTPWPFDDPFQIQSSPSDETFNPNALTIIIDNRKDNQVQIINRPYGSIRHMTREVWGQLRLGGSESTYVSGGFVRRFYSPKNNVMVSYYFDHNSTRWVKGIQDLPDNIPNVFSFNQTSGPLVFMWIDRGRHSTIPL